MHSYATLSPTTFLERSGRVFPHRTALIHSRGRVTYAELLHRARCLAQMLLRLQVSYGDRVAVLTQNNLPAIEAHFSIPSIGGIIVMVNPWLPTTDLLYILNYCEAKVLILDADLVEKIPFDTRALLSNLQQVVIIGFSGKTSYPDALDYETYLEAENGEFVLDQTVKDELEPLAINFTSGTTGRPKGVMCSHRGAYLNGLGQTLMLGLNKASKYLWVLPMFHVNGWGHIWANVALGATQVLLEERSQELETDLIDTVSKHNITHLCGAPRLVRSLTEIPGDKQSLRGLTITTGGAAPTPSLIQQLEEMGVNFVHQYGLNETYGPYVVCEEQQEWQELPLEMRVRQRMRQGVATIHAGTGLRVVDAEMQDVPRDGRTLGEVIMAGNTVALGYYKNPEATEKAFRQGWFHSGDMAVVHPDGYLEIRDRIKDLIYVETDYGWENISSIEIEHVLCRHTQVREAAVIGISADTINKNAPVLVAFIEMYDTKAIPEENLRSFCGNELASYKQPQVFYFTDLPKTATGKVRKDLLIADALTRLGVVTTSR